MFLRSKSNLSSQLPSLRLITCTPSQASLLDIYTSLQHIAKCFPAHPHHRRVLLMAPRKGKYDSLSYWTHRLSNSFSFDCPTILYSASQNYTLTIQPYRSTQSSSTSTSPTTKATQDSLSSQRVASYLTDSVDWKPNYQNTTASAQAHTEHMKAYLEEFDKKMASSSKKWVRQL